MIKESMQSISLLDSYVWYFCPRLIAGRGRRFRKLTDRPLRIVRILNDVNYVIQKTPSSRLIICHVDRLLRYEEDSPAVWVRYDEEKSRIQVAEVVSTKREKTLNQRSSAGLPRSHSNSNDRKSGPFKKSKRVCSLFNTICVQSQSGTVTATTSDSMEVPDSTDYSARQNSHSDKSDLPSPKVREHTRPVKSTNRSRDLHRTSIQIKGPRDYRKTMTVH